MKGRAVIIGLVVGLTIVLLVYFFATRSRGPKYQWFQTFRSSSEQPYGTMFIQRMLKTYYEGEFTDNQKDPIHKLLEGGKYHDGETDYVLIGQSIHLDDRDVTALTEFINHGGNVFIATMEPPLNLLDSIGIYHCDMRPPLTYAANPDSVLYANFYDKALNKPTDYEFRYRMGANDYPYSWDFIDSETMCDSTGRVHFIGYQQSDFINYVKITYGDGNLFLHTGPLMFTNYFMTRPDKMEYASAVFSHLDGRNVIWDEVSKVPYSNLDNPYDSPLYYIMQQPALKYAWWMLIAGAVLYVIFASKRTQRIIPVIEPKSNTSLEFLNVISSLHYQNPNHLDMARKKMKYFLYFIRAKYGINTQNLNDEQSKRLAERSKVDLADIQAITERYKVIDNYAISNDEPERLIGLYQAIEKFYKTCK